MVPGCGVSCLRFLALVALLSLLAMPVAMADDAAQKAQSILDKLDAECEADMNKLRDAQKALSETDEYKAARQRRDRQAMSTMMNELREPVIRKWRGKYMAAQEPFVGQDVELRFAASMLKYRLPENGPEMVARLLETHAQSPELERFADYMSWGFFGPSNEAFKVTVQRIIDENPRDIVKAQAYFARASFKRRQRNVSEEDQKAIDQDLEQILELVPHDSLLGLRARGPKFEQERLQIGQQVPDIEGSDLAGVPFKLSDYQGKVIVLDFWGNW